MRFYGGKRTTRSAQWVEWKEKIDRIFNLGVIPKRMFILMFMIDGYVNTPPGWPPTWVDKRGGHGMMSVNCEGGIGFDAVVRRMIRDGEVTLHRPLGHSNPFCGNPTINRSHIKVTSKGREVYAKWKQKNGKRFNLA